MRIIRKPTRSFRSDASSFGGSRIPAQHASRALKIVNSRPQRGQVGAAWTPQAHLLRMRYTQCNSSTSIATVERRGESQRVPLVGSPFGALVSPAAY